MSTIDPLKFREIILNTRKPLVLKNFQHNWPCFEDGLEEWCKTYDNVKGNLTTFERIFKVDSKEPQWERKRQLIEMSAMDFFTEHSKDCEFWSGLNYKRRNELPIECTRGIDFSIFGFPQAAEDSTLWLSSTGANTPCHYDTYGCNIVVQVFGRKSWLLFPPETPLKTTRIPYEESSIYCLENFYAPKLNMKSYVDKFKNNAYHVILEPNDVLIVPKHWWHYVEALETSLSINAWIPLEQDLDEQIEELIVKYLIESFVKDNSLGTKENIMNPNQLSEITPNKELFTILNMLLETSSVESSPAKKLLNNYKYHYLSEDAVYDLLKDVENLEEVTIMSLLEFVCFLKTNSLRYHEDLIDNDRNSDILALQEILINSICSPHIVESIKLEFYKRHKTET